MPSKLVTFTTLCICEALFLSFYCIFNLILCFQGVGTNERCLIEVLASRNNKQIHEMVAAYKDGKTNLNGSLTQSVMFYLGLSPAYGSDLEEDVIADTSGHFKKMLVVLLQVRSPLNYIH